jgi:hypothetical protein
MTGNLSEQRQKLATLREPFRVEEKHHYLQETVKNAGTRYPFDSNSFEWMNKIIT